MARKVVYTCDYCKREEACSIYERAPKEWFYIFLESNCDDRLKWSALVCDKCIVFKEPESPFKSVLNVIKGCFER